MAKCWSPGAITVPRVGRPTAFLYDPATGNWTAHRFARHRRYEHTATLLNSGKVLVVGGNNSGTRVVRSRDWIVDAGQRAAFS